MDSPLSSLTRRQDARTARVSSWDQRGRNQDNWTIGPGETRVLADLEGPGQLTHIWTTQFCRQVLGPGLLQPEDTEQTAPVLEIHNALGLNWEQPDPDYYRKVLLRITWDDEPNPAVLVPLGDFFGIGHCLPNSYSSALFTVSAKPEESLIFGGSAALNCWVPMPFNRRAKVEIVNENDLPLTMYFYIDYELFRQQLPEHTVYFHARWTRSDPCDGWGPQLQTNSPETNVAHLSDEGNFVLLETTGSGHYIGCNLSVHHRQGSWWGEGDDMIFIDDDTWPPSLHGTGTEDYFNHAWGMQKNAYAYHGTIVHESDVPGYSVTYRQHVVDPVRFSSRIKVSIEHGHANHLSDDWAATAYWYQTLPSPPQDIAPLAQRLPHRPSTSPAPAPVAAPQDMSAEVQERTRAAADRFETYQERMRARANQRAERSRAEARANTEHAADIRRRFQ
ncbi:DUF2961 domain-containing protein [Pedococcus sp. 5OH_020]|uniref:DUF2961 domain-containing protein n=1 Tax=Pedococcus sp. 5OH_020 TaxID=2989814 RepID=UPI0022E9D95F|nr:DUF2961 domain-containing protein [Pedococcus sp. 5OH_020]